MTAPTLADLTALWYRALASEFGLRVEISDTALEFDLYEARRKANDPRLAELKMTRMKDGSVWLVKKERSLDDAT